MRQICITFSQQALNKIGAGFALSNGAIKDKFSEQHQHQSTKKTPFAMQSKFNAHFGWDTNNVFKNLCFLSKLPNIFIRMNHKVSPLIILFLRKGNFLAIKDEKFLVKIIWIFLWSLNASIFFVSRSKKIISFKKIYTYIVISLLLCYW